MKAIKWLIGILALFFLTAFLLASLTPATYLKIFSEVGVWPISLSWAVNMASEHLESAPLQYCEDPFLLSWWGSFGEFNLLPENVTPPELNEYTKLVLGRTDYINESTSATLTAMSNFNSQLVARCF